MACLNSRTNNFTAFDNPNCSLLSHIFILACGSVAIEKIFIESIQWIRLNAINTRIYGDTCIQSEHKRMYLCWANIEHVCGNLMALGRIRVFPYVLFLRISWFFNRIITKSNIFDYSSAPFPIYLILAYPQTFSIYQFVPTIDVDHKPTRCSYNLYWQQNAQCVRGLFSMCMNELTTLKLAL